MSSVRLNEETRVVIWKALMTHRFGKEEKKLKQDKLALGDKLYNYLFSKKQRDLIDSLEPEWLAEREHLTVYMGGQYAHLSMSEPRRVPYSLTQNGNSPRLANSHEISKEWHALHNQETKLQEEMYAASAKIKATLKSYGTLKTLIEAWPEVKKFCPKDQVQSTVAIAIRPKELNDMLGLP